MLALLAVAGTTAPLRAQGAGWLGVSLGTGNLRVTCASCAGVARAGGSTLTLTVGGAPSGTVLLGLQGQVWWDATVAGQEVQSLGLVAQWYPWRRTFFLRGGTGLVRGSVAPRDSSAQRPPVGGSGIQLGIGFGADLRLTRRIALTLDAGTMIAALGDLAIGGITADDTIAYVSRIGVGVTVR